MRSGDCKNLFNYYLNFLFSLNVWGTFRKDRGIASRLKYFTLSSQRLDEMDFGEKKEINKRKELILEGKVPTEPLNQDFFDLIVVVCLKW